MTKLEPVTELHPQFSSEGAAPTQWEEARSLLEEVEIFWVSTVRPDGRPHVTPLIAVWLDGALYFCTGPEERKAKNLKHNSHCILTTGCNIISEGIDLVVEGDAIQESSETKLRQLADMFASKYDWHFDLQDDAFLGEGGRTLVYEVRPKVVFGFGKGDSFSQTRWRFQGMDY